jgi:phospholipid N-methyltransferase
MESSKAISRWQNANEHIGLTWGCFLDTTEFINTLNKHIRDYTMLNILEIGPGYGRITESIKNSGLKINSYVGLDINQHNINKLEHKYPEYKFKLIDINTTDKDIATEIHVINYNIVICSSTFEHFYPNFNNVLNNIHKKNVMYFIDFIDSNHNTYNWEQQSDNHNTYIRCYNRDALYESFTKCGYSVVDIDAIKFRSVDNNNVFSNNEIIDHSELEHNKTVNRLMIIAKCN